MRKKYIVAIDSSTNEQNTTFLDFVKAQGFGWWHWIKNVWLLTDPTGRSSSVKIRDKLMKIFTGEGCIVIELAADHDTWAAFGPKGPKINMFDWLNENWEPLIK